MKHLLFIMLLFVVASVSYAQSAEDVIPTLSPNQKATADNIETRADDIRATAEALNEGNEGVIGFESFEYETKQYYTLMSYIKWGFSENGSASLLGNFAPIMPHLAVLLVLGFYWNIVYITTVLISAAVNFGQWLARWLWRGLELITDLSLPGIAVLLLIGTIGSIAVLWFILQ